MVQVRAHAVQGVIPPQTAEAKIAGRWPSVAAYPAVAKLGSAIQGSANRLIRMALAQPTIIAGLLLVPIVPIATALGLAAWFLMAPFYFIKVLPFLATRYTLTNRRLMIQRGLQAKPRQEVKLEEIEEVRIVPGSEQRFYLSADLEIISGGRVVLTLRGVPEYQAFKVNIENTYLAWGRKSPPKEQIHPASEMK